LAPKSARIDASTGASATPAPAPLRWMPSDLRRRGRVRALRPPLGPVRLPAGHAPAPARARRRGAALPRRAPLPPAPARLRRARPRRLPAGARARARLAGARDPRLARLRLAPRPPRPVDVGLRPPRPPGARRRRR